MNVDNILQPAKRNKTFERPVVTNNEGVKVKKIGRNELCPCGSELKYKICCGNPLRFVPAYDPSREYSDRMGEKGVFKEMAALQGVTADMTADDITEVLKKKMADGSAELLLKIFKKYNRNSVVQPGMFTDVLQIANFYGGRCQELSRRIEDLETKVATQADQILKLKAGIDETNSVSKTEEQAA